MSSTGPTAPGTGNGTGSGTGTVSTTASTSSKSLLQQLPAGAVLAFQALAGTFTNQGKCLPSNWWLTVGLVSILSSTCIFFSFTDSLVHEGKVYYGVALPGRLNIINMHKSEERIVFKGLKPKLRKHGLKTVDWVHAFLSLVVFLTIAGSDVGLQKCFFPTANDDTQQLLKNLPLGMAVMSTFLFMIFPTTRKGIRFDNSNAAPASASATPPSQDKKEGEAGPGEKAVVPADTDTDTDTATATATATATWEKKATDKAVMSSASLMQLLPTGPVLAFQTLAASFTNQGQCLHSNWWLTVGLVVFLGATCIFSAFTDCVQELKTGKPHKGVALPGGLYIIGMPKKKQQKLFGAKALRERCLKTVDWIHAFFSAVVFLTIAGSDVGLQKCFFPNANDNTQQLLKNLPLGMAVMSSFVFMVFPTTRSSMCFDDSDNSDQEKNLTGGDHDPESNAPTR